MSGQKVLLQRATDTKNEQVFCEQYRIRQGISPIVGRLPESLVPPYPFVQRPGCRPVPTREPAALDDQFVGPGILQEIMEDEACIRILPTGNLAETQVIE